MANQSRQKKNSRLVGMIVIIIIILAGLGVYSYTKQKAAQQLNTPTTPQQTQSPGATVLPSPKTIAPFTLTDDAGKPFTNENLKGYWTLLFFGFTHCSDVCPTTLTELNNMYRQMEKNPLTDILPHIVFVSVDPERDTTDVLHSYVQNFNPQFIGASGNTENLNVFVKDLGLYYAKAPGKDSNNYGMNHSSQIYLINPEGQWVGILSYPQSADELMQHFKDIITHAPA